MASDFFQVGCQRGVATCARARPHTHTHTPGATLTSPIVRNGGGCGTWGKGDQEAEARRSKQRDGIKSQPTTRVHLSTRVHESCFMPGPPTAQPPKTASGTASAGIKQGETAPGCEQPLETHKRPMRCIPGLKETVPEKVTVQETWSELKAQATATRHLAVVRKCWQLNATMVRQWCLEEINY